MKNLLVTLLFLVAIPAWACWRMEGTLGIDGETYKIDHRIFHDEDHAIPLGPYIMRVKVKPQKKDQLRVTYSLQEKKNLALTTVTEGTENLKVEEEHEILAKGMQNQPHSIITLKLTELRSKK